MGAQSRMRIEGWRHGYRQGWNDGYHYGRSQAIFAQTAEETGILYDLHVVFVAEGLFALNEGIQSALSRLVSRVTVVNPAQPDAANHIASLQPDLVLVLNGIHAFPAEQAAALGRMGIRTAVWFADDPYYTDLSATVAPHYDYVFTHELNIVSFYEKLGCRRVFYLPLAASRHIFYPQPVSREFRPDVCFIGTAFWNRVRFFDKIVPYLRGKHIMISGGLWNRLKHYNRLKNSIHLAGTPFEQTASYYSGAKIVINLHRASVDLQHNKNSRGLAGSSVNPRTFEISACGTLQITDIRQDLTNFYVPGKEIETYSSERELIDKINHYLANEDQRSEIALQGLQRTLRDHTYRNRLIKMMSTLFDQP